MASTPDYAGIKQRQQVMWSAGNFSRIATPLVIVSETLCEAVDLRAGQAVLDVACGNGNTAIAAARRKCMVTGIDYVPALIEHARSRAAVEPLDIDFQVGDAEALPFEDASFDVVMSTFGTMFAPNQALAAAQSLRVCRPGGRIAMANWTPDGFAGRFFRAVSSRRPSPPGMHPPVRWGTEEGVQALLGDSVSDMSIQVRHFMFRDHSPQHWLDYFRTWFGPMVQTFSALDEADARDLAAELIALTTDANIATDGTLAVPAAYLEVVAVRG